MRSYVLKHIRRLREGMSDSQLRSARAVKVSACRLWGGRDLVRLARLLGCVKMCQAHAYGPHYKRHFAPYRQRRVNILEIGIGGYDNRRAGGASL